MTPTHSGMHFGRIAYPFLRRSWWAALALVTACVLSTVLLIAPGSGTTCLPVSQATHGPDLQVTAVPGVDLTPVLGLPGLSAASGPYPGVASSLRHGGTEISTWIEARPARGAAVDRPVIVSGEWPRRGGGVVVEQGLARRLRLQTGRRVRVVTTRGPLALRVTGIAATSSASRTGHVSGLAFVVPQDLHRVAPAAVHGSTVLLDVGSGNAALVAGWLQQRYPGPQAVIDRSFSDRCVAG
jgi:hypothetical protein